MVTVADSVEARVDHLRRTGERLDWEVVADLVAAAQRETQMLAQRSADEAQIRMDGLRSELVSVQARARQQAEQIVALEARGVVQEFVAAREADVLNPADGTVRHVEMGDPIPEVALWAEHLRQMWIDSGHVVVMAVNRDAGDDLAEAGDERLPATVALLAERDAEIAELRALLDTATSEQPRRPPGRPRKETTIAPDGKD